MNKTKNSKLSYIDTGKGNKTLLFIHGFCGSHEYWSDIIAELKDEYRVVAVDLRGHGASEEIGKSFSIEDMAADIASFLEDLKIGQVYMFGHSLGGYVTLAFAERFPGKLSGFSLIHSTAFPDDEAGKEGRLKSVEKIEIDGIPAFIDGLVPKLFAHSDDPNIEHTKEIGYKTSESGAIGSLHAMRNRIDRNHVLKDTKLPVLLVAGEQDKVIPAEKTFSVKGSHINEVILEGSGHMGMLEAPNRLIEEIIRYVEKN
ncbi:alpha/beta hydrolase [Peribacillus sp. NJ4]|uniref:alpha/beta fold hydrolase n=1 Tax=Peribacillus sp. NJ4 TaxID=3055862 RepID=UPI0025A0236D|nr:alpha/beta hydrolase [Peribacillus sp. NJ4]MDM5211940.1 alpha/beta hydrolase [Peribacillus sp. NJ4]